MDQLEKNRAALKEYQKLVWRPLQAMMEDENRESRLDKIETLEARDGSRILSVVKDGETFRLNSMYRPQAEADKWCAQYELNNLRMNILMFGLGNGIFAKKLLTGAAEDATIYLYEPSADIFLYVLSTEELSDIFSDARVRLYVGGCNEKNLYFDLANNTHWSNLPTQRDCAHPVYPKLFRKEYNEFCKWIEECDTVELVNKNTGVNFAASIAKNALNNLPYILDSNYLVEYIGSFPKELPAIIVSAGPSLDKNIKELKRAEGKALIMATDTAVRRLLEEDVHFDCMVTVDPRKPKKYLNLPGCAQVPLFCSLESNFRILEYHQGRKIWFRDAGDYMTTVYKKYDKDFLLIPTGGCVATTAFSICETLGFQTIVLIGQDLAYDGEFTHAGQQKSKIKNEAKTVCMVEGIDGTMVRSRGDWKMYLEWFERNAERVKTQHKDARLIDATEGGARIHGMELMTLREVIDTFCKTEVDIENILIGRESTFAAVREDAKKELLHTEKEFRSIASKAEKASESVDKALKILDKDIKSPDIEKYTKEIVKANNFISKQKSYAIIDSYIEEAAYGAIQNINVMTGDEWADRKSTIVSAGKMYRIVADAVEELQPIVDEAMEKLKEF